MGNLISSMEKGIVALFHFFFYFINEKKNEFEMAAVALIVLGMKLKRDLPQNTHTHMQKLYRL